MTSRILPFLLAPALAASAFAQAPTAPATPAAPKTPSPYDEQYKLGPDSQPQPGVPEGKVTEYDWNNSKVFPGTERKYWVYVPAQYDPKTPAAVMVFQDGGGYVKRDGGWRVPVVFDNLIAKKEMPVTIGIFINPGEFPAKPGEAANKRVKDRSMEYDSLGDKYARFLLEEILPEVGKTLNLTKDPNLRAIQGSSSGGICAFNVAWERPNEFHKVLTTIGSFTNIRGGDKFPDMVRAADKKPIRVFQEDGTHDIVNQFGSWPEANKAMAAALDAKGYDHKFVVGEGTHNSKHAASILPDALRWLWRP